MVSFLAIFINFVLFKEDNTRGHFAYILIKPVLHFFFSLWHLFLSETRMVKQLLHNYFLFILNSWNISESGAKKINGMCWGILTPGGSF